MVLPFVEVSHLPQSTSFYSSVLQPLGLRYLSADREQNSSIGTVTYGYKPGALGQDHPLPILQLREAAHPLAPLKLSSLVLTAPSHDAVVDFHACGLDANPWLRIQQNDDGSPAYPGPSGRPRLGIDGGVSRANICDLDGNMLEVVYPPPSGGSRPATYNGVPIRQTQSNRDEAVRILDWNYDVAARSARAASHHSSTSSSHRSQPQALAQLPVRPRYPSSRSGPAASVVSATMSHHAPSRHSDDAEPLAEPSISPRQSSTKSGLNTTNVVGALLGVAAGAMAGAALTYGMVNKEKERRPRHEQDHPMLPRRSTYPEKIPRAPHHSDRHSAYGEYPPRAAIPYPQEYDYGRQRAPYQEDYPPQPFPYPGQFAPQPAPHYDDYAPRTMPNYAPRTLLPVESSDESTSESEDEDPPEPRRRPVRYLTDKSHHSSAPKSTTKSTTKSTARSVARSRAPVEEEEDEAYDTRSRHSSRHKSSRAPSMRPRSEAPVSRALTINDEDRRSRAASRPPKSTHSQARQRPSYDHDRDSYFSAKSRRSGATTRPPPAPELVEQEIVTRSRSGSRITTTKLAYQQGRPVMVDRSSKAPSRVSARNIQLPMSNLGSSHANWDDDMESVAPSDSISCIGSKTSRRSRRARA